MGSDLPLVIRTDRLVLRPLVEEDVDALVRIYARLGAERFLGPPPDRAGAWRQVALAIGHRALRGYTMLGIVDRATGELIGRSGPWFPEGWPLLEVGWVVDRPRQGSGIATEAARASLRWCYDVLGADSVCSIIRAENEPSRQVARKIGGRVERVLDDFLGEPAEVWVHRPGTLTPGPGDQPAFADA